MKLMENFFMLIILTLVFRSRDGKICLVGNEFSVVKNCCNCMLTKSFQLVNKDFLGDAVKCLAKIKAVFSPQFSHHLSSKLFHHRRLSSNMVFLSHLLDLNLLGNTFHDGSTRSFPWEKHEPDWRVVSQIFLW